MGTKRERKRTMHLTCLKILGKSGPSKIDTGYHDHAAYLTHGLTDVGNKANKKKSQKQ